jgi:hypothetical protein
MTTRDMPPAISGRAEIGGEADVPRREGRLGGAVGTGIGVGGDRPNADHGTTCAQAVGDQGGHQDRRDQVGVQVGVPAEPTLNTATIAACVMRPATAVGCDACHPT